MIEKIRVYAADDHIVVRTGMTRLLSTFSRVGETREASNGKELIKLISEKTPDAVFIDIEMPVMSGFDTAAYIAQHFTEVKMIVLTMHAEEVFIKRLMDLGVHGYLSKTSEPEEIEKALYSVVDLDFYKNDIVDRALQGPQKKYDASLEKLSNREIEILVLICQEYSSREISARLGISEKTFNNHRANIIAKTGVKNNIGLYKFAVQRNIYCPDVAFR
jgi:two-component system, NarL family, response regulator DegU